MLNLRKKIALCVYAMVVVFSALAAPAPAAHAATIASTKQGLQQWHTLNGKLIMVTGTYQDTTTYKRSLTFYFEEKAGGEWQHVPVIESEADHTLTWFSVSAGETTDADAVVSTQGEGIYLITATRKADKNSILVNWYKFVAAGDDFPDGPAYLFKSISNGAYPKTRMSIEEVLKKESALKAKK